MRHNSAWFRDTTFALLLWSGAVLATSCDQVQRVSVGFSDYCEQDEECDDGVYCNGPERCERTRVQGDGSAEQATGVCCRGTKRCGASEVCIEAEEICVPVDCYGAAADQDGDGSKRLECGGSDCDDTDARRFPGNAEICDFDHRDEDCDPQTYGARDADRDGFMSSDCCNMDGEGDLVCGLDCDDQRPGVHPVAVEACNAQDDDCDGASDEGVLVPLYADADRDGYGSASAAEHLCADSDGYSPLANDCDDTNPAIGPGSMRCAGEKDPAEVLVCTSTGAWTKTTCGAQLVCVVQPNRTGICR